MPSNSTKERKAELKDLNKKEVANISFELFARIGYFSKGMVYILCGMLSFLAAISARENPKGTEGVLAVLAGKPFGEVLLWLLAAGLLGHVFWRIYQVLTKREIKNQEKKKLAKEVLHRIGYTMSAIVYGALAYKAIKIAMHASSKGDPKESFTAMVLSHSFGQWVVATIGIIYFCVGLYEFYAAIKEKFLKRFDQSQMSDKEISIGKKAGKIGMIARGWVFLIIGYFFVRTAITSNSENAIGMDEALFKIAQQPFGKWMLGIVAAGLFLFGVFEILKGKNRHMRFY